MWIVDLNRQSLDRVIPGMKGKQADGVLRGAGWHVVEAKYGRRLQAAFARPGGDALRRHIDDMSNEEYQSLFAPPRRRAARAGSSPAPTPTVQARCSSDVPDDELAPLVQNLGGHDLGVLLDAYRACDAETDRPSVVFAYTVKGWGLPIAGDPLNHAALLSADADRRRCAPRSASTLDDRVGPLRPRLAGGRRLRATGGELEQRAACRPGRRWPIPDAVGVTTAEPVVDPGDVRPPPHRPRPTIAGVGARLVTTSPDVTVSTNLGGWINKMGVFAPAEQARLPRRRTACCAGGRARPASTSSSASAR